MGIRSLGNPTESYNAVWSSTGQGAAQAPPPSAQEMSATGGTTSTYNDPTGQGYKVHKFEASGSFVVTTAGSAGGNMNQIDYLLIAGGGGGGGVAGGGAGGLIYKTGTAVAAATYPITIGAGGSYIISPGGATPKGNQGANNIFDLYTPVTELGGGSVAG